MVERAKTARPTTDGKATSVVTISGIHNRATVPKWMARTSRTAMAPMIAERAPGSWFMGRVLRYNGLASRQEN